MNKEEITDKTNIHATIIVTVNIVFSDPLLLYPLVSSPPPPKAPPKPASDFCISIKVIDNIADIRVIIFTIN